LSASFHIPVRVRRVLLRLGLVRPPGKKAILIHIQKTAGTSMVRMLSHYYADSFISHADYLAKSVGEVSQTRFVSGHFGYAYAKQFMADRFSFTFLREPRERIMSFYVFCKSQPPEEQSIYRIAREHRLDRFLELGFEDAQLRQYLFNHQVWQMAAGWAASTSASLENYHPDAMLRDAVENANSLDLVGIVADFEQDFRFALRQLGLPASGEMAWKNKSADKVVVRDLSPRTLRLIDRLVELDQKLYEAALELREKRV
jgi:RNase P/RNase MRP subunit POP5